MDYTFEDLRKVCFEPAKQLVEKLEQHYDHLTTEQRRDLAKLKFGLTMYELEQQEKTKGGFRWA